MRFDFFFGGGEWCGVYFRNDTCLPSYLLGLEGFGASVGVYR